ncbi:hypothetical protein HYR99_02495 [Candidatus Poribacteria bacterium]|nr:hypothetical protein [Candidatus Poribacteria bacterium]
MTRSPTTEFGIWTRALSEKERNKVKNGSLSSEFKLVGYWPFSEGSGTVAGNKKTGGTEGTLGTDPDADTDTTCPEWIGSTLVESTIYNPTQTYAKAGDYSATLRVKANTGRWSTVKETTISVTDGSIGGTVRAADLRTPVSNVRLTLSSSHVHGGDLSELALPGTGLQLDNVGGIYTLTAVDGNYSFGRLPLGNYRLLAIKVEDDGTVHEFEKAVQLLTLSLNVPDQEVVDFVDLSVFPVGGRIRSLPYDLDASNPETPDDDLLAADVVVEAKPISTTSAVESDPSDSTADATNRNYSLPLFGGKYQFFARHDSRDIRLDPDTPGTTLLYDTDSGGNTSATRIITITGATGNVHFIDYTKRTLTVTVEDSSGFPIQTLADLDESDPLYNKAIEVNATLSGKGKTATNAVEAETDTDGNLTRTYITYELPPGEYTIKVASDFEGQDIVFRDDEEDPDTLAVTDQVSQESDDVAAQQTLTISALFDTTLSNHESELNTGEITPGLKSLFIDEGITLSDDATVQTLTFPNDDGTGKWMITDGDATYFLQADGDNLHVDYGTYTVTGGLPAIDTQDPPNVIPKSISFHALKDGYRASDTETDSVIVLGDRLKGTASQIVSIPNINYLVLHDPPGDQSKSYVDDSLTVKGIVSQMSIRPNIDGLDRDIPVYPAAWSVERKIQGVDYEKSTDLESTS